MGGYRDDVGHSGDVTGGYKGYASSGLHGLHTGPLRFMRGRSLKNFSIMNTKWKTEGLGLRFRAQ